MGKRWSVKFLKQLILASGVFPFTDCCQKVGRVRFFWRRKKGESKVTTGIYYLLQSACETGNSKSIMGHPLYLPDLVCKSTAWEKLCFLYTPSFACFPPLSAEKNPNPDIVPVNCLNINDLKYFVKLL